MDRINGAGHDNHMFAHEDSENNQAATEVTAAWLNIVQEELVGIATDEGEDDLEPDDSHQAIKKIKSLIAAAVANIKTLPVGTEIAISGDYDPVLHADYLVIPTASTTLARADYPELFDYWGTTFGAGDGVTTFGMKHIPGNYAQVQASAGNRGTLTVGEVIEHDHPNGFQQNAGTGQSASGLPNYVSTRSTGVTGGPANLAAGSRVTFLVKYR